MPKAFFRSITLCALTACGDATGVDKFPTIDGSWSYTNNWSGGGISCSYAPGTLTITQTGGAFRGILATPDVICTIGAEPPSSIGSVSNRIVGTVSADGDVTFGIGAPSHTGSVSGNSMSGSFTFMDDFFEPGTLITFTGPWTATR